MMTNSRTRVLKYKVNTILPGLQRFLSNLDYSDFRGGFRAFVNSISHGEKLIN